jgi:nicotinate dehydrogenase subunit B
MPFRKQLTPLTQPARRTLMPNLDRRSFLQSLGGGLLVMLTAGEDISAQESGSSSRPAMPQRPANVAAWLHIGPDGKITAFTGKVEVGQNIRTSLTQAVADELRCPPASVTLVMGDTALTPWDMGTFGSLTTPTMAPEIRKMAATARESLIGAAAKQWGIPKEQLRAANGYVSNNSSRLSYGDLAAKIDWVNVIGNADLVTKPPQWEIGGTSLPKINARDMVTGKHKFVSDHKLPRMLYGRVLRPPTRTAKRVSVDTAAAEKMPGVVVVRDGEFIGVAAPDERIAEKALASIEAKWEDSAPQTAGPARVRSEVQAAKGATALQSNYNVAYIAHVPLEPRAAVAEWNDKKLVVSTGTQRPFGVRTELAAAFGLPETDVHVLMPDTGSGYGGKHSGECAIEAARLAKAAGKPVKLIWTREEEFNWAYLRPAGTIEVDSVVDSAGKIVSWKFHNYSSGPSGLKTPYEAALTRDEQFIDGPQPFRVGSYRGLASTANNFARESHIDEIAAKIGVDPLAFRLNNLKNERLSAVLKSATDKFEWSKQKSTSSRGFGLACGVEKGGYIACCVEIAISPSRQVKVERVVSAWECGAVVNPNHLHSQVEGSIVMGLGGALFEEIDAANGKIQNPRLSQYRVPRFTDVPKIDVILIDRRDLPSAGAGETPIVGIAPAIANAIFSATGLRIRSMPLLPALARA